MRRETTSIRLRFHHISVFGLQSTHPEVMYPVKLLHAYHLRRAGATAEAKKTEEGIVAANGRSLIGGGDSPYMFMQNAAILALRGETSLALDEVDRAYASG